MSERSKRESAHTLHIDLIGAYVAKSSHAYSTIAASRQSCDEHEKRQLHLQELLLDVNSTPEHKKRLLTSSFQRKLARDALFAI